MTACSVEASRKRISPCSVRRDERENAVHRLRGVHRVERREDEVARVGGHEPIDIVSLSRISPRRMTSGSWRRICFKPSWNDSVSIPLRAG